MKKKIVDIYTRYGFTLQKEYPANGVLVFLLKAGYFKNVDIVPLNENANAAKAFKDFSDLGYACSIRPYSDARTVDRQLFEGFFSIESNRARLKNDYTRFTDSIVKHFGNQATYTYLNAPYTLDGVVGTVGLLEEIISKITSDKPMLFLIEAAAGFGKTCAAYELVSQINDMEGKIPLFAELSRNRQARIFKHILLDEIDRTFPLLSSKLVQHEILNGRVITILDGFDELLRDGDTDQEFDNREPMLETIGEYLKGSAKIILTTRRTILFEGDDFHKWAEKNESEFSLIKIKIGEPKVNDWLTGERLELVNKSGIEINSIANPVLLSFLRCISETEFIKTCNDPETIVESYFEFILEREKTRQELWLDTASQNLVLEGIAQDMIDFQYKSEDRDYIVSLIIEKNSKLIDQSISSYPADSRPSREEVANKLASHALLDRSTRNPNKIGFINEFVLGNYVAKNIIKSTEWFADDWNFLEPAILSYKPRSAKTKNILWEKIQELTPYIDLTNRVFTSLNLLNNIKFEIQDGEVDSLPISDAEIGRNIVRNIIFNECTFSRCKFNLSNLDEVTFLNCRFYECKITNEKINGHIHMLAPQGDSNFINEIKALTQLNTDDSEDIDTAYSEAEKSVLEKFWPVGRETITYKHRPIKGICVRSGGVSPEEMFKAVGNLKKKHLLIEPRSPSFVEINFDRINEIKEALGR